MAKLQIGNKYVTRDGVDFTITDIIATDDLGYSHGYRFKGVSDITGSLAYKTTVMAMWDADGKHKLNVESSPHDLIHVIQGVPFDEIRPGLILGNIHCGELTKGQFSNWELASPFEIEKDMFVSIYERLDRVEDKSFKKNFSGKTVYAVSATEDVRGNASTILAIYEYDNTYRCVTLIAPEWKSLI